MTHDTDRLAPELDVAKLDAYLKERLGLVGELTLTPTTVGRSNETHLMTKGPTGLVLRLPPRSGHSDSAHDLSREHRFYTALAHTGVPVPDVVGYETDETILGRPFLLMDRIDGVVLATEADSATFTEKQAHAACHSLV